MNNELIHLNDYCKVYSKDQPNIIAYCQDIQRQIDESHSMVNILFEESPSEKPTVFKSFADSYRTQQYVGIIAGTVQGANDEDEEKDVLISIGSRFDNGKNQHFLNYVFAKAFDLDGRIFQDMHPTSSADRTWDVLLMIVFVNQLEAALKKGYYRQYRNFEYNDSNIRGRIDIARHIKANPFNNGKVAYTTRELSVDNAMNHLLLLAFEHLEKKYKTNLHSFINKKSDLKKQLTILKASQSDEGKMDQRTVLKETMKPIHHPYYHEYEQLRKTSILILRRMGLNIYQQGHSDVQGVLINMNSLWEKFLHKTVLGKMTVEGKSFRASKEEGIIFDLDNDDPKRSIELDFHLENNAVFDAKYKNAWSNIVHLKGKDKWQGVREDVFQVLAYMLTLDVKIGGVIFPARYTAEKEKLQVKKHYLSQFKKEHYFYTIPYVIQENRENYIEFEKAMDKQNEQIIDKIKKILEESSGLQ